jgi:hypothetical protein
MTPNNEEIIIINIHEKQDSDTTKDRGQIIFSCLIIVLQAFI